MDDCTTASSLPVLLPSYAVVSGTRVLTTLECRVRCTGTITLELIRGKAAALGAAARASGRLIGKLEFTLPAKKSRTLRVPLNKLGRKDLKHAKTLRVAMAVLLKPRGAKAERYSQPLELAKAS